jgi:phage/conjugal plasmid C-4 type zinc finger TraR family protein
MATGWAPDGAVQDQIDATIKDGVERAREELPKGPSLERCEECDARIPAARQAAVPGVRLCVGCQKERDLQQPGAGGYNRRGSKDSQLR